MRCGTVRFVFTVVTSIDLQFTKRKAFPPTGICFSGPETSRYRGRLPPMFTECASNIFAIEIVGAHDRGESTPPPLEFEQLYYDSGILGTVYHDTPLPCQLQGRWRVEVIDHEPLPPRISWTQRNGLQYVHFRRPDCSATVFYRGDVGRRSSRCCLVGGKPDTIQIVDSTLYIGVGGQTVVGKAVERSAPSGSQTHCFRYREN